MQIMEFKEIFHYLFILNLIQFSLTKPVEEDSTSLKDEDEEKSEWTPKHQLVNFYTQGLNNISKEYCEKAKNISEYILKDEKIKQSESSEIQEFKKNITEFLNKYDSYARYGHYSALVSYFSETTLYYVPEDEEMEATNVSDDAKYIKNLLKKLDYIQLDDNFEDKYSEFIVKKFNERYKKFKSRLTEEELKKEKEFIKFYDELTACENYTCLLEIYKKSVYKKKDILVKYIELSIRDIYIYYGDNAAIISYNILKDAEILQANTAVIKEFKKNISKFVVDFNFNDVLDDLPYITELYTNATAFYFDIPKDELNTDTKLIVSVLRRLGAEKLETECKEKFRDLVFNKISKKFVELKSQLTEKEFETFIQPVVDWYEELKSDKISILKALEKLHELSVTKPVEEDSTLVEDEDEEKTEWTPKQKLLYFHIEGVNNISKEYCEKAKNISEYILKDDKIKQAQTPEIQEFKKNITEFLNKYDSYARYGRYSDLVSYFSETTLYYAPEDEEMEAENVTDDAKYIKNLLKKLDYIQLDDNFEDKYWEFIVKEFNESYKIFKSRLNEEELKKEDEFIKFYDELTACENYTCLLETYDKSVYKQKDNLEEYIEQSIRDIYIYYGDNAANISNNILKDDELLQANTSKIQEFKNNISEFVEKFNSNDDLDELPYILEIYKNSTAYYFDIPKDELNTETNLIVSILKRLGSEKLEKEFKEKCMDLVFNKISRKFVELKSQLSEKEFETLIQPVVDWYEELKSGKISILKALEELYEFSLTKPEEEDSTSLEDEDEEKSEWTPKQKLLYFYIEGLNNMSKEYCEKAKNISEYILKDEKIKQAQTPEIQEFKQNITEFLNKYDSYARYGQYSNLVPYFPDTTLYYAQEDEKMEATIVTDDVKYIKNLLEKLGYIQMDDNYKNKYTKFIIEKYNKRYKKFKSRLSEEELKKEKVFINFNDKLTACKNYSCQIKTFNKSVFKQKDNLVEYIDQSMRDIYIYYGDNALNISNNILKDAELIEANTAVIQELKKNISEFVEKFNSNDDLNELPYIAELYTNATTSYFEIPKDELNTDTKLIVSALRRLGAEKLETECEEKFMDLVFNKISEKFVELKSQLDEKDFETLIQPVVDWCEELKSGKISILKALEKLYWF